MEIKEEVQTLVVLMEILVDLLEMVALMVEIQDPLVVLVEEMAKETLPAKYVLNQTIQLLIVETELTKILFQILQCRIQGQEQLIWLPQKELLIRDGIWTVEPLIISPTMCKTWLKVILIMVLNCCLLEMDKVLLSHILAALIFLLLLAHVYP